MDTGGRPRPFPCAAPYTLSSSCYDDVSFDGGFLRSLAGRVLLYREQAYA
jgi:hypothetical protein